MINSLHFALFASLLLATPGTAGAYNQADLRRALAGDKNLACTDLQAARLDKTDLSGADLSHTNLSDATLDHVNLSNAKLIGTNLERAHIYWGNFEGSLFDGANLSRATLTGNIEKAQLINNTSFVQARLDGADFCRSNLNNVNFSNARFEGHSSFRYSKLDHVNMQECRLLNLSIDCCSLSNINLQRSKIVSAWINMRSKLMNEEEQKNGNTWINIDLRRAIIFDTWIFGDLIYKKEQERNPELESLKPSSFYKLLVLVSPLLALKKMFGEHYDEHNINSVFINARFEGVIFLDGGFTNVVLRNCTGIESLAQRRRCLFANIVVENTEQKTRYTISDK